jgi:hypothetical protein
MKVLTNNPLENSPNADEEFLKLALRSNAGCKAYVDGKIFDLNINSRGKLSITEMIPEIYLSKAELAKLKEEYGG